MFFGAYTSSGQKVLEQQGPLGQVWISGYQFAHDIKALQSNGIHAICSAVDLRHQYPKQFTQIVFPLDDSHLQQVGQVFEPAYEFIETQRMKTNVLVHCAAGISRSSAVLISYMMKKYKTGYQQCLTTVRKARGCCQPNMGFARQLREYQKALELNK